MKNIFILLIGLAGLYACQTPSDQNVFNVSGEISGLTEDLLFKYPNREYTDERPYDTIRVENGKFHFSDTISEITMISAFSNEEKLNKTLAEGRNIYSKAARLMFFAIPGGDIKIAGKVSDFMDAYPSGDVHNESLAAINRISYPFLNEAANIQVKSMSVEDEDEINQLRKAYDSLHEAESKLRMEYLEKNPNTLGSIWQLNYLVGRGLLEDEKAIALFENVSKEFASFNYYQSLQSRIEGVKSTQVGMTAPELKTTSTVNDTPFDLTSLRGKYVMLDFWGMWCGPCMREMPTVAEYQKKYEGQLVVVGINSGDKKDRIQKFVAEKGYGWQQLMNQRESATDNFVTRFNVIGFPTKFIIDPEGKIVKRFLGGGEEAFKLLEDLLDEPA